MHKYNKIKHHLNQKIKLKDKITRCTGGDICSYKVEKVCEAVQETVSCRQQPTLSTQNFKWRHHQLSHSQLIIRTRLKTTLRKSNHTTFERQHQETLEANRTIQTENNNKKLIKWKKETNIDCILRMLYCTLAFCNDNEDYFYSYQSLCHLGACPSCCGVEGWRMSAIRNNWDQFVDERSQSQSPVSPAFIIPFSPEMYFDALRFNRWRNGDHERPDNDHVNDDDDGDNTWALNLETLLALRVWTS